MKLWFLHLLWQLPFRLQGRWWICSSSPELVWVWDYFPVLSRVGSLLGFWTPDFGSARCQQGIAVALLWGGSTSLFPRIMYGLTAPCCQSLTTPESVYVAVPSARVKMQDGREGRKFPTPQKIKHNKTEHQDRAKLNKNNSKKKNMLRGTNKFSEVVVRGFLGRGEWYPKG